MMKTIRLSELVINGSEDRARVAKKPVVDETGKFIGSIETIYYNADNTISRVVIKTGDGLRVMVRATNLFLNSNEDSIVWVITPDKVLLEAIREALNATLDMIELYSTRGSSLKQHDVLLRRACEHLANALQLLQPQTSSRNEPAPSRELLLSKDVAERAEPA